MMVREESMILSLPCPTGTLMHWDTIPLIHWSSARRSWNRLSDNAKSGAEQMLKWTKIITRCPKAICGHRFPCPVVSIN